MDDWMPSVADGAVLLTVNQRLSRHLTARYQRWQQSCGQVLWETPQILPWRAWFVERHVSLLDAGLSDRVLLPDIVAMREWRHALDADDNALLHVDLAARQAANVWQLAHAWHCLPARDMPLSLDQQAFVRWAERYRRRLQELEAIDEAQLEHHVRERLPRLPTPGTGGLDALPQRILLAGFLRESVEMQHCLDVLQELGVSVERVQPGPAGTLVHQVHASDRDELLCVAATVRDALERDPAARLGVVVPDLATRRDAVVAAFDEVFFPGMSPLEIDRSGRPYDVSLGLALAEVPVIAGALRSLRLLYGHLSGHELSAWLLDPWLLGAREESSQRQRLDRQLRERRLQQLDTRGLLARLTRGSVLARALDKALRQPRDAVACGEWARRFSAALESLGWPGRGLDSSEYQAVEAWKGCLDDLQRIDDGEPLRGSRALQLLERLARERLFQVEVADAPVQVMGRLESHGMQLDALWVIGLDASQWPPAGSPSPFLPIAQQRRAGMPEASAEARLALAEAEFDLWCASAPSLTVSYAASRGGIDQQAAAVLASLPAEAPPIWQAAAMPAAPLETLDDTHGPALPEGSPVRGGARLLENQAMCPFRAFALHRLAIRPLEEPGPGLDPRQRGTLLHRVLELLWERVQSQAQLQVLGDAGIDTELATAIDRAMAETPEDEAIDDALAELERRRLQVLLGEWLREHELTRQPFEVIAFEEECEFDCEGIGVTLKVDRRDRLQNGAVLILDYKTGTHNDIGSWNADRIENPQLPLYALTDSAVDGVSFAQIARHKHAFIGVGSEAELLPGKTFKSTQGELKDWADWRAHWQSSIEAVAREIRQGLASVTPRKGACAFCDVKPLCRIDAEVYADDDESMEAGRVPELYSAESGT